MGATLSKAEYDAIISAKDAKINALEFQLQQLEKMLFGFKSERHVPAAAPEQMELFGGNAGAVDVDKSKEEQVTYSRRKPKRKPHPGRAPLPDHLPRRRVVLEPKVDTTGMVKIGEDITTKVDYIPGQLDVVDYVRPRYVRPEHEQTDGVDAIVQASVPDQVLPKAIAGGGLLAHIAISKFIDHLPLYRQRQMFQRDYDWEISPSTFDGWFAASCKLLEPLYLALQAQVLNTAYLQGDESRLIVLEYTTDLKDKTKNKSHRHPPKQQATSPIRAISKNIR
ncbi:MAG: transposase [Lewinella sp.]